jgi:two-component system nitrate/nitrite response regulator NarL
MNRPLTFLIADDHLLFVEGLKMIVETNPNYTVVETASNGEEVMIKLSSHYIDIILMDINMPKLDGLKTTKLIAEKFPEVKVIGISSHHEKIYIEKMYQYGAMAYLGKNLQIDELMESIQRASDNQKYYSNEILQLLFDKSNPKRKTNNLERFNLTNRELEVLTLIGQELTSPEIAKKLCISSHTVISHRKNLLQKLNVHNIAGLVKYALEFRDSKY